MDKVRRKSEEMEKRSAGEFMEIKDGKNRFMILPPWNDEGVIWKEVQRHGLHVCPDKTVGKRCVMCEEIVRRTRKGDTDFANEYRLKATAYVNAIKVSDIKGAEPADVKVLRLSTVVFADLLDWIDNEDTDPTNPTAAYFMTLKKTGKGMATRYKTFMAKEPIDVSDHITDAFLEEALYDLDTIRAVQPAGEKDLRKEMRKAAGRDEDDEGEDLEDDDEDDYEDEKDLGVDDEDDLKDDEEADEEEDEVFAGKDEDEEDDLDEDEEDDPDDEDDLDDDDDEDEPPPPPKKSKVQGKASPAPARKNRKL